MSEKLKLSINKREMKKEIQNIEQSDYFFSLKTQIKKIKSGMLSKTFHGEEERYEKILNEELSYSDNLISGLFSERFRFNKYEFIIGDIKVTEIPKISKSEVETKPTIKRTIISTTKPEPKKIKLESDLKKETIKISTSPKIKKEPLKVNDKPIVEKESEEIKTKPIIIKEKIITKETQISTEKKIEDKKIDESIEITSKPKKITKKKKVTKKKQKKEKATITDDIKKIEVEQDRKSIKVKKAKKRKTTKKKTKNKKS
ncbi:MAG: hypothetical protein EAX96_16475 [Candidatus Lokiarchaeota archaeon]|nr:hypothetical protein [Candidatus Lokiarchaeota archaeon]